MKRLVVFISEELIREHGAQVDDPHGCPCQHFLREAGYPEAVVFIEHAYLTEEDWNYHRSVDLPRGFQGWQERALAAKRGGGDPRLMEPITFAIDVLEPDEPALDGGG